MNARIATTLGAKKKPGRVALADRLRPSELDRLARCIEAGIPLKKALDALGIKTSRTSVYRMLDHA